MNPLVTRILREKRAIALPLALALLANIAAYFLVVRPRAGKAAGAADRAAAAKLSVTGAEKDLAQAQALVAGKAKADEELSAFYKKVLPADLPAANNITYATLPAMARNNRVKFLRRSMDPEPPTPDKPLGHLSITMVLQGEYENLRAFIYELESAPQFIILDDLALSEARGNEPLTLTLRLSTYYKLATNGA